MSKWKTLSSRSLFKAGLVHLRSDQCELPDGRVMPNYYVFEFPDWVNVLALTPDRQLILVRQHRHAAGDDFLEIPGGSMDPGGDSGPQSAAERELLEETGYTTSEWIYCGGHFPNPALQSNRLHTFVALNCRKVAEPMLDPFEDMTTELHSVDEIMQGWLKGEVQHSLISASIALAARHLGFRLTSSSEC